MPEDRPTILAVDDEPQNLKLLERTLRREYNVLTAESGRIGLERLAEHPEISVIISDQRMPDMTGIEMLKISRERNPDKVRIILTGYADPSDLIAAINSSRVFCYVGKPWKVDEMQRVLRRAVNLYRAGGLDTHDEMTGLPNHLALERILRREIARSALTGTVITVVAFHFEGISFGAQRHAEEEAVWQLGLQVRKLLDSLPPVGTNPLCFYRPVLFVGAIVAPAADSRPLDQLLTHCMSEIEGSEVIRTLKAAFPQLRLRIHGAAHVPDETAKALIERAISR